MNFLEENRKGQDEYIKKEKENPVEKKLGPYDFCIQIADKKTKLKYNKKVAPGFLLLQWFSHVHYCIDIVHEINHLQFDLNDDIIYKYLFLKIPKNMRIPKWIKKESMKNNNRIDELKLKYGVSTREALMIKNHEERINGE
jgi:hypothetical protein